MFPLIADVSSWTLVDILIAVVVIGAVIGIVYIALQQFGISIPQWAVKIFWIVVVAIVAVFAIRFLVSAL